MLLLMRLHHGIGLAAPQVGVQRRLFVCEIQETTLCLVNPEIRSSKGTAAQVEGCLSLPKTEVDVVRNEEVHVRGYDGDGQAVELSPKGLWARVIQHEIDHLNGILIFDRGKPMPAQRFQI
jgi:peptide deformylase